MDAPKDNLSIPELEEKVTAYWEANQVFQKSLEKTKDGTPFTFYDGPPFATGLPHYGHILASTIKDVIPRYQTMRGRYVRRRWGWDCHGLPIEEIVERQLGISGKKQIEEIGIGTFNETCRSTVLRFADEWGKMVRRMGRWVEFDNAYKTMDREYMESVWWAFKQLYDKELVYEGRKVLLYCPRCETPVSNFEVAMDNSYKDVTEESVYVKFKIKPGQAAGRALLDDNTYLLAWTTTPWTLPGNVALAVGSEVEYVLVKRFTGQWDVNKKAIYDHVLIAKDIFEKYKENPSLVAAEPFHFLFVATPEGHEITQGPKVQVVLRGSDLVGLAYEPLFDVPAVQSEKTFKVYAADFVTTEDGTGIVHTAVVYGEDDYQLGLREGLPVVPLLDEKGHFNDKAPELIRGQYFKKAEKAIKDDLAARNLLLRSEAHTHSYPHCWRCGTALYYSAIPAWFVNVQKIKKDLLASNEREMQWYPGHLKHGRYQKSVEAAPDWNISRNRYWGNPIPVWKCASCDMRKVVGSVAELGQEPKDLHRPYIDEVVLKCECGGEMRRTPEIFDSWVEAGSMPFAEHHYPFENKEVFESRYPAQFVAEYIAQTRAWFYVMHVVGLTLFGKAPFENVVTTGTILAEDGSKMSKSKNNYPDPWAVIEKYGVDSLRFYLMNSVVMQADNLNFSEKDLANVHRKVTMLLWNVFQYYETYAPSTTYDLPPTTYVHILDRWIMARTKELVRDVTSGLDGYDTVRATRSIQNFIDDLSTWYLRRSRGRDDAGFYPTFREVLLTTAKVIAPFMPHIADSMYLELENSSVHLADWPTAEALTEEDQKLLKEMEVVREAASVGLMARKTGDIPVKQPLASVAIGVKDPADFEFSDEAKDILRAELNVKKITTLKEQESTPAFPGNNHISLVQYDYTMTPELAMEGLTRVLERFVQEMRKSQGLKVGEMATLIYETTDTDIEKALGMLNKTKMYLASVERGTPENGASFDSEGKKATFGLRSA